MKNFVTIHKYSIIRYEKLKEQNTPTEKVLVN